jgi:hypothetical protein
MTTTQSDVVASGLVAVLLAVHLAYVAFGGLRFVRDPTGMAGLAVLAIGAGVV